MMSPTIYKQTRWTILLSINAAAILVAGVLISIAIFFSGGFEFRAVNERSDIIDDDMVQIALLGNSSSTIINEQTKNNLYKNTSYIEESIAVPAGEIWNEEAITIYATPDSDICVGGGLSDLGATYWQTSNPQVIAGFYNSARTWLGYDPETCRYPIIAGSGTTTVTVGTYDGKRKDSLTVTVINPPIEQWKRETLNLVNNIRATYGIEQLAWSAYCEQAANIRAHEIMVSYSHSRPDGSDWSTLCQPPNGDGINGENIAIGNAAVSPITTVMLWMGSESHKENILNPEFTKLAIGFVFDIRSEYKTYWSQIFSTY